MKIFGKNTEGSNKRDLSDQSPSEQNSEGFVRVRGAKEHNLKDVDVDIPRNKLVVFTGISGSGKSSLAFGTIYAEAQRRYLESVSPYARRLFNQMNVPEVSAIHGLPPAVALQQSRGGTTVRSTVGSVTTISNLLRMLYSRAGDYPPKQSIIYAEGFSPNTPEGACPVCHGIGRIYDVTEKSMVPDDSLTIRERAVAAWPSAWQGQNLREILMTLGFDVDKPWKDLPKKDRDWILFTDETPTVPVYSGLSAAEVNRAVKMKLPPSYMGTFTGAKRYVLQTFANTNSQMMKRRVSQYMLNTECSECHGKRLKKESLAVKFEGFDIADLSNQSLSQLMAIFTPYAEGRFLSKDKDKHPEKAIVAQNIAIDLVARLKIMIDLGLGYLSLERSTPSISPGELQRLRLATQVHSNLFGVIYVLDEPSAGLHPADTEALLAVLIKLKDAGNSMFIVEHEVDIIRHCDWVVDVGPQAGANGGEILYSGPLKGLQSVERSVTRHYIDPVPVTKEVVRTAEHWLRAKNVTRNNIQNLDVSIPLGVLTSITGTSGSGKSSLVSQALVDLISDYLGQDMEESSDEQPELSQETNIHTSGVITVGMEHIKRLVRVDQKPIGRTPRSNLATYTGLFDRVRQLFAETELAKKRKYDVGRFSFNVAKGRCAHCKGEGFVMVELLFLPSVYTPCPTCKGTRYNDKTLEVKYDDKNIAEVLDMTVDQAWDFFSSDRSLSQSLEVLRQVGLGYIRLGQPATELSGGEAQRIKLASELQRTQKGKTLYVLDEPTTGLHPSDVEKLIGQLNFLVDAGNTVITVEHDMHVVASSDWVIDLGPGAGKDGGKIIAEGAPRDVAKNKQSKTAKYLAAYV
ncbi:excinuclease ABC subunit A [Chryseobacterium sp. KBW03]|uniref:UvrABC system protein A n=1 Tax=Sphingobacterium multivorum TaxID=28454 RepID=A0A2X2JSW9_SPHMU|nr:MULTISPECIES: excinuclease ABC subunit UvrA [Bacteroidota]MEB4760844.1 excinuclease ABC subunit UvrA [Chryseobacterium indologenes]QRQ63212.1 excinuclease ABC subunit UvrA [Sphingobacterium multivorum]RQO35334.1 excinuclease ABC subunit A [Chryseobacterium sp. KBW03]SPZ95041.1 Excinuclease ABC subunit A [Sphingobacterium multivorum]